MSFCNSDFGCNCHSVHLGVNPHLKDRSFFTPSPLRLPKSALSNPLLYIGFSDLGSLAFCNMYFVWKQCRDGKVERWGVKHLRRKLEKLDKSGGGYLNKEKGVFFLCFFVKMLSQLLKYGLFKNMLSSFQWKSDNIYLNWNMFFCKILNSSYGVDYL